MMKETMVSRSTTSQISSPDWAEFLRKRHNGGNKAVNGGEDATYLYPPPHLASRFPTCESNAYWILATWRTDMIVSVVTTYFFGFLRFS